jgi:hypothetical protein
MKAEREQEGCREVIEAERQTGAENRDARRKELRGREKAQQ